MKHFGVKLPILVVLVALFAGVGTALADDEAKCLAGRAKAKAQFERCITNWLVKIYANGGTYYIDHTAKATKCHVKYSAAWNKLQGLGTTCNVAERFVDNGDGTITDHMTGLVWEKKADTGNPSEIHDVAYIAYPLSADPSLLENGAAYTTFLRDGLNAGAGFAGANDWRIPTFPELMSLLAPEPYPCESYPCTHPAFDNNCTPGCSIMTCSCMSPGTYVSQTNYGDPANLFTWGVTFTSGQPNQIGKYVDAFVRAVRGGL